MDVLYFTLAAAILYLASDWILRGIERYRGALLPHRSLIFFAILLTLAVGAFTILRNLGFG